VALGAGNPGKVFALARLGADPVVVNAFRFHFELTDEQPEASEHIYAAFGQEVFHGFNRSQPRYEVSRASSFRW